MQNKSAALSNRCCGGTSCSRLTMAVELKAQEGHGVRLFRGLSEAIIGKCLTIERVGCMEDPSLVSASTTPFQSSAGLSTSGMGQGPFVMDCGPLDLRTFCVEHGLGRFFYCFFFFHFPVSQCTYVSVCLCFQFSDRRRRICPTCVRKLGQLRCCLSEEKQFIRDLQNEMSSVVLQTTRLFYANFQFTSTAS